MTQNFGIFDQYQFYNCSNCCYLIEELGNAKHLQMMLLSKHQIQLNKWKLYRQMDQTEMRQYKQKLIQLQIQNKEKQEAFKKQQQIYQKKIAELKDLRQFQDNNMKKDQEIEEKIQIDPEKQITERQCLNQLQKDIDANMNKLQGQKQLKLFYIQKVDNLFKIMKMLRTIIFLNTLFSDSRNYKENKIWDYIKIKQFLKIYHIFKKIFNQFSFQQKLAYKLCQQSFNS